ncbi:MAG: hypothetical protein ACK5LZ_02190 [Anaerorhabdus sp.]
MSRLTRWMAGFSSEDNYLKNKEQDQIKKVCRSEFINGQACCEFASYKISNKTVSQIGCGVIALYNVERMMGKESNFSSLIKTMEQSNYVSFRGWLGIKVKGIKAYLLKQGYSIKVEKWWQLIRNKIDLTSFSKEHSACLYGYAYCGWGNGRLLVGAHYVTFQKFDEKQSVIYNFADNQSFPIYTTNLRQQLMGSGKKKWVQVPVCLIGINN